MAKWSGEVEEGIRLSCGWGMETVWSMNTQRATEVLQVRYLEKRPNEEAP